MRHIHLNPLGGAAGDMFVACMLDAFPAYRETVTAHASEVAGVDCRVVAHTDDVLTGTRFIVTEPGHHHHAHAHWRAIRARLAASSLPVLVREHAIGIFTALAEAEGRVHGVDADDVVFHEVGAADSIADVVAAGSIIAAVGPARWSIAPLPIGGGTVETAHGVMPVPAPATALLLEGFAMQDDGVGGERVTPTGAAILHYLGCKAVALRGGTLRTSGTGFGTRRLPGRSNCLRALVFDDADAVRLGHRELGVISFEVDDQSGEDLAMGLDRVRRAPGVHDIVQMPAFGKKGRFAVHIQVLTAPEMLDEVIPLCFRETTTIGLRTHIVQGRALPRRFSVADVAGQSLPVKLVERPGLAGATAVTAKAEADSVRDIETHAERIRLRQDAERAAEAQAAVASASIPT